jgi:hypothetical protein
MNRLVSLSSLVLALGAAGSASAGITIASSTEGYQNAIAGRGYDTASFLGASIAASAGGAGWNAWSASASPGGLYTAGVLSTLDSDAALTISFVAKSVNAVGGNFYITDASRQVAVNSLVEIMLDNGEVYVSDNSAANFAGFVADANQYISSITIKPMLSSGPGESQYATVGSMIVSGVPAPGSLALLGAAGLAARRKRR